MFGGGGDITALEGATEGLRRYDGDPGAIAPLLSPLREILLAKIVCYLRANPGERWRIATWVSTEPGFDHREFGSLTPCENDWLSETLRLVQGQPLRLLRDVCPPTPRKARICDLLRRHDLVEALGLPLIRERDTYAVLLILRGEQLAPKGGAEGACATALFDALREFSCAEARLGLLSECSVRPQATTVRALARPLLRLSASRSIHMTARESEVAVMMCAGLSRRRIARALNIAPRTVDMYVNNLRASVLAGARVSLKSRLSGLLEELRFQI